MMVAACTLGQEDRSARVRQWKRLAGTARPSARHSGRFLEISYQSGSGVFDELEALVASERQCCAFVDWDVVQEVDGNIMRITAKPESPDDIASLAALFSSD